MNPSYTIKSKVGDKDIVIDKCGYNMWLACCWCNASHRQVLVPLTEAQAEELLWVSERPINELSPDMPSAIREIFLTGLTPQESKQTPEGE
jgi:hypothetical protein